MSGVIRKVVLSRLSSIYPVVIAYYLLLNIALIPIALIFILIRPFYDLRFVKLNDMRIGHLAANTDLFLRRQNLGMLAKAHYIGISSNAPANRQLLRMFSRKMRIRQIPVFLHKSFLFSSLSSPRTLLSKLGIFQNLPFETNEWYEFSNAQCNLEFTQEEKKKGRELAKQIGLNSWYICIHARDDQHFKKYKYLDSKTSSNYRNCQIDNYIPAARYIVREKGMVLRMGELVEKPLKEPSVIDYASKHRSDFGDIYLTANCKFFLGCTAGIWMVPHIFHVPIAMANSIPWHTPMMPGCLHIPKKLRRIHDGRLLKISEMLELEAEACRENRKKGIMMIIREDDFYERKGVVPVENTAEEILDLAIEMNERIDGRYIETEEDKKLQERYKSLIKPHHFINGSPATICTAFLRKNRELLS